MFVETLIITCKTCFGINWDTRDTLGIHVRSMGDMMMLMIYFTLVLQAILLGTLSQELLYSLSLSSGT